MQITKKLNQPNLTSKTKEFGRNLDLVYDELRRTVKSPARLAKLAGEVSRYIPKFKVDPKKYPNLTHSFDRQDLEFLEKLVGCSASLLQERVQSPLEKILFSVLWKNGDLNKIHHVVRGLVFPDMNLEDASKEKGSVFCQFGRHLRNPQKNPIADQHTIRAYRYLINPDIGTLSTDDVKAYVRWVETIRAKVPTEPNFIREFDGQMYAIGKATKKFIEMCENDEKGESRKRRLSKVK